MKHTVKNCLGDFAFHDVCIEAKSCQDNILIAAAKYLNIHGGTKENPCDIDMEIDTAIITVEALEIIAAKTAAEWNQDALGNWCPIDKETVYEGKEAEKYLAGIFSADGRISLNGLSFQRSDEQFVITFDTNGSTVFSAVCTCAGVTIEWDEYRGKAWYVK